MREKVWTFVVCAVALIGLWQIGAWLSLLVGPFLATFAVLSFLLLFVHEANALSGGDDT